MDDSPLAKLPAEIRNNIIAMVLILDCVVSVMVSAKSPGVTIGSTVRSAVQSAYACIGTCKQLREECGPVFYASNTFVICTMLGPYVATRWTQKRHPDAAMEVTLMRGGWWYCLGDNVQHLRSTVIKYPEPFALYQSGDLDEERGYLLDSIGGLRSLMRGTPAALSASFTFQWDKNDDYFDEAVDEIHAHRCSMSVPVTGSWEAARSVIEHCMRRTLAECYEDEPLAFVAQQLGATRDLHIYGLLNDLRDRGVFSDGAK
ncbi:hypothetical protein LTR56_025275 [Elasticomyces elasticus]|nr:hypothetical protein LTR56_025275 [Elasticomyces elasticus]